MKKYLMMSNDLGRWGQTCLLALAEQEWDQGYFLSIMGEQVVYNLDMWGQQNRRARSS